MLGLRWENAFCYNALMSVRTVLNIPQATYRKAMLFANEQDSDVEQLFVDAIRERFEPFPLDEQHDQMQREIAAYQQLHPMLVQTHLGDYVAVYQGKVVDYSTELDEIADRIDENYPDQVVLVRQVQSTPNPVLRFRSPRLISDK